MEGVIRDEITGGAMHTSLRMTLDCTRQPLSMSSPAFTIP